MQLVSKSQKQQNSFAEFLALMNKFILKSNHVDRTFSFYFLKSLIELLYFAELASSTCIKLANKSLIKIFGF